MSNLKKSKISLFVLGYLSSIFFNINRTHYAKGKKAFTFLGVNKN